MCERLAEHCNLIVSDVFIEVLTKELVDRVNLYLHAKLALDHSHWNISRTETWNICTLAIVFECLLDIILEVFLFDGNGQQTIDLVGIFE